MKREITQDSNYHRRVGKVGECKRGGEGEKKVKGTEGGGRLT